MSSFSLMAGPGGPPLAVVPILVGPLQALAAILPGIFVALGTTLVAVLKPSAIKRSAQLLWAQKVVVAAVAVGVWGLLQLWGLAFSGASGDVGEAEAGTDWTMWRGGASRRGAVLGETEEPAHGKVVWAFSKDGINSYYSSPTVVGNRVYATSAKPGVYATTVAIACLDARTGQLAWEFNDEGYRATFSSPAVSGKYLAVGEGLHTTSDARVYCLDIEESARERRGVKLWSHATNSHVESSPCIADGKVFIGAGDDGLYCLDLEGDGNGAAKVLWHVAGEKYQDCETSPVYHEGKLYFGLGIGGQAVVCLDADTGAEEWRIETPCPVFSSPTVADGKMFFGMGHGDFVNTAERVREIRLAALLQKGVSQAEAEKAVAHIQKGGEVWCVDLKTRNKEWRFKTERTVLGTIAEADGKLFFGARDGHVYCLDAKTGEPVCKPWDAHGAIVSSLAVGRKYVYAVTSAGILHGLDRERLIPVWKVSLGSPSKSSPALAMGRVYLGTIDNGLMCVGRPGAEVRPAIWQGALGGPGKGGWVDDSAVTASGSFAWTGYVAQNGEVVGKADSRAPVACVKEAYYVGLSEGGGHGLARLDHGADLSERPVLKWLAGSANPVYISAAATEEAAFFVDGRPGEAGRELRCLDPATGTERWSRPVEAAASGEFFIAQDRLFIADRATGLTCLDVPPGRPAGVLWSAETGSVTGTPFLAGDILLVSEAGPDRLSALDAWSGARLWSRPLPSAPRTGPVLAAGRAWVGLADGVAGFDPVSDGAAIHVPCGAVTGRLVSNTALLACVTEKGEAVLIDPEKGEVATTVRGAVADLPPVLTHDAVLYFTDEDLRHFDLNGGRDNGQRWCLTRWMGKVVAPAVVNDSYLLFATERRGLVCLKPEERQ